MEIWTVTESSFGSTYNEVKTTHYFSSRDAARLFALASTVAWDDVTVCSVLDTHFFKFCDAPIEIEDGEVSMPDEKTARYFREKKEALKREEKESRRR